MNTQAVKVLAIGILAAASVGAGAVGQRDKLRQEAASHTPERARSGGAV